MSALKEKISELYSAIKDGSLKPKYRADKEFVFFEDFKGWSIGISRDTLPEDIRQILHIEKLEI